MKSISLTRSPSKEAVVAAECVNPLQLEHWDRDLAKYREATFFHTAAWARVLADTYRFNPCYFRLRNGSRPATIVPAMEVDSFVTGRRAVSLPFTDRCEILGDPESRMHFLSSLAGSPTVPDRQAQPVSPLWSLVEEIARERRWLAFESRDGSFLNGVPSYQSFHEHILDLSGGEKRLLARQNAATRRNIQKAARQDLKIEVETTLTAMRDYYRLHGLTRKKHGLPPQPWAFFENIWRHVLQAGYGFVILARAGGEPVAGAVFFHFGRQAIYKFGGSDPEFLSLRGNNLVMWEAIRRLASDGFLTLNFGRSALSNPGLRRFKEGWGAEARMVGYTRFDFRASRCATGSGRETGWQTPIFQRMPLSLARFCGRLLYRHMA